MGLRAPIYAQVELTYSCNLGCPHCLNDERYGCGGGLETQLVKKEPVETPRFRDIAQRLVEWGVFTATLTGGEPLMVRERLFEALPVLSGAGLYMDMNSNLCLMDEDTAKQLVDMGLRGILTSLSSHIPEVHNAKMGREYTDPFNKTLRGIEAVQKVAPNIFLSSNMVLANDNYEHVYEVGALLAERGVQGFTVTPLTPSRTGLQAQRQKMPSDQMMLEALYALRRVEDDFGIRTRALQGLPHCFLHPHILLRKYMQAGCDAGKTYITVNPFGQVKACSQIPDEHGNILTGDLDVIWERMNGFRENAYVPSACAPCDLKTSCGGGCRAEAERRTGTDLVAKHPFMRRPLHFRKVEVPEINIDRNVGETYKVHPNLMWREEGEGAYLVQGPAGQYVMMSGDNLGFLSTIMGKGGQFKLTSELAKNQRFAKFVVNAIQNSLLEVA